MSLLFNMLANLDIAFLPRSKRLLISWLQSPSAVILELKKIKFVTVSIVFPSICHEVIGLDVMKAKVKVAQSYLTCEPGDYTVHGVLQARILECVAFPFSRGFSQPRD